MAGTVGRPPSVPYKSMRHDFPIPLGQTRDKWDVWRVWLGMVSSNKKFHVHVCAMNL
jgi:hypothetical protein